MNVSIQEHIYIFYESTLRYLEDKEAVEKNVYIDNLKEMEKEIYTKLDDVNEAYLVYREGIENDDVDAIQEWREEFSDFDLSINSYSYSVDSLWFELSKVYSLVLGGDV